MDNLITITRLMIALVIPPQPEIPDMIWEGYLSAYNQNPTDTTLQHNASLLPQGQHDGYIAVLNCSLVGTEFVLSTVSGDFNVVAFDCANPKDGGDLWMVENGYVAEIDYYLWQAHPEIVGSYAELTPLIREN